MPFHSRDRSGPLPAGPKALLASVLAAAMLALGGSAPGEARAESKTASRPEVGRPAPDFRLEALGKAGDPTTLKGLEGKVVLLDFWASWCAPCKRTLPEIARMGARHPGLKVLAVSLDEDRRKAQAFLKDQEGGAKASDAAAPGAGLDALHDAKQEVAARYDLAGMPSAVLIDRKGVLRARYDGYTMKDLGKMEAEARKLLEEKP